MGYLLDRHGHWIFGKTGRYGTIDRGMPDRGWLLMIYRTILIDMGKIGSKMLLTDLTECRCFLQGPEFFFYLSLIDLQYLNDRFGIWLRCSHNDRGRYFLLREAHGFDVPDDRWLMPNGIFQGCEGTQQDSRRLSGQELSVQFFQ